MPKKKERSNDILEIGDAVRVSGRDGEYVVKFIGTKNVVVSKGDEEEAVSLDSVTLSFPMEVGQTYWFIENHSRYLGTVTEVHGSRFRTENDTTISRKMSDCDLIMIIPKEQIVYQKKT